jgi:hypothetical protein
MLKAIGRNAAMIGGLILGATLTGLLANWLVSARGALGPLVFEAESIPLAMLAAIVSVAICTALAIAVGRVSNTAVGMFVLGGGLYGLAWRAATVDELALSGSPTLAGVETLYWAGLLLAATSLVFRLSGPLRDIEPDEHGRRPHPLFSAAAAKSAAAGILVIPVVWIIAQSEMKGQVIGAVFLGAMVAGLVGRLLSPHVQPILLFAAPLVFGAIGQFIAVAMLDQPLVDLWVSHEIPRLLRPMPVDYATGSLMGVAVGLGWAKSFLHHEDHQPQSSTA